MSNGDQLHPTDKPQQKPDRQRDALYAQEIAKARQKSYADDAYRPGISDQLPQSQIDGTLDKAREQPLRQDDASKHRSLADTFRDAKYPTSDEFINDIPKYREKYGIPDAPAGKRYGGWKIGGENARRIDFYFTLDEGGRQGTEKPVVYRMLDSLTAHADSVAKQIDGLKNTKSGVDTALTLVITQRESTRAGFGSSPGRTIDSYHQGGLDSLYQWQTGLKSGGYLPADFPQLEKTPGPTYNELGNEVFPAKIPQDRVVQAYGAVLNQRCDLFVRRAKTEGFSADQLSGLSVDARRVWTVTFFISPAQGEGLLRSFRQENKGLNDIIGDESARRLHSVRRALVNAAEAELLENRLKLPGST